MCAHENRSKIITRPPHNSPTNYRHRNCGCGCTNNGPAQLRSAEAILNAMRLRVNCARAWPGPGKTYFRCVGLYACIIKLTITELGGEAANGLTGCARSWLLTCSVRPSRSDRAGRARASWCGLHVCVRVCDRMEEYLFRQRCPCWYSLGLT